MAATLELTSKEDVTEKLFKLEQQNLRLIEQNKRLAQESKRAHKESADGIAQVNGYLNAQVSSLKNVALGFVGGGGIVGAVQTAIAAYTDWENRIKELGERSREVSHRIVEDIVRTQNAADAVKISAMLKTVPGATRAQAEMIYRGASGVLPFARPDELAPILGAGNEMLPFMAGHEEEWGALKATATKLNPNYPPTKPLDWRRNSKPYRANTFRNCSPINSSNPSARYPRRECRRKRPKGWRSPECTRDRLDRRPSSRWPRRLTKKWRSSSQVEAVAC